MPSVAVIGAGDDRRKFGNKAVRAFARRGYTVYPVHPTLAEVEGLPAYASVGTLPAGRLDVVTFYVPPSVGLRVVEALAGLDVGELWLNPGAGSPELVRRAGELGLNVVEACSILRVGERPSSFADS